MRSLFFCYSLITLCLFLTNPANGQTGNASEDVPITSLGTIHNEGDDIQANNEYCLNDDNELIVYTNIVLGGLTIQGVSPDFYGVIPEGYPDMYIEYTINGQVYPPTQVGNFEIIELPNGYPAFSYMAQSPTIDFSDDCNVSSFQSQYIYTTVSFRLVTPDGLGWKTYPACNYAQSWDMFSCYIYSHAPWCDNGATAGFGAPDDPGQSCYDEWFAGGFSAFLYCDCADDGPTRTEDPVDEEVYFARDNSDIVNRVEEDLKLNVYPNPMTNILSVDASGQYISKIEVFDLTGKLMLKNIYSDRNTQSTTLNTENFQHGLYLVKTTTNKGISVIKVLK